MGLIGLGNSQLTIRLSSRLILRARNRRYILVAMMRSDLTYETRSTYRLVYATPSEGWFETNNLGTIHIVIKQPYMYYVQNKQTIKLQLHEEAIVIGMDSFQRRECMIPNPIWCTNLASVSPQVVVTRTNSSKHPKP